MHKLFVPPLNLLHKSEVQVLPSALPEYICKKMDQGDAVIALDGDKFAGFCYIETWDHQRFVANSGLIVHPDYRNQGLAKKNQTIGIRSL